MPVAVFTEQCQGDAKQYPGCKDKPTLENLANPVKRPSVPVSSRLQYCTSYWSRHRSALQRSPQYLVQLVKIR